ncbi:MAG: helix-turn-helix transcriptional regulator [bacterium]|nr:helix-turn-helix transcriptional regulator [bacterium]
MNWTQKDLADRIDSDQTQISAYERGDSIPSTNVVIKLSKTLNVTTDYLLFDDNEESAFANLKDKELLKLFEKIELINEEDKQALKQIIEITIIKNQLQSVAKTKII